MRLIETIKKKIARRKERKAIMSKISFTNGTIVIDADIIATGSIGAYGYNKFGKAYVKFDDTHYSSKILADIKKPDISTLGTNNDA